MVDDGGKQKDSKKIINNISNSKIVVILFLFKATVAFLKKRGSISRWAAPLGGTTFPYLTIPSNQNSGTNWSRNGTDGRVSTNSAST